MKTFRFEASQFIPRPRDEVFPFFSEASNLQAMTPPWLHFHIETPTPIEMRPGALIDYRLRVHGFPMRWRTRITVWDPPYRFVDEQVRGPYRLWHHEHVFEDVEGGTWMHDTVHYAVTGGVFIDRLFIRRDVERIFAYRTQRLMSLFSAEPADRFNRAPAPMSSG